MRTTTRRAISNAIKQAGLERSSANMSSRVGGWCSSSSAGIEIADVYPWKSRYTRNGRYYYSYITEAYQEIKVEYATALHPINHKYTPEKNKKELEDAINGFNEMKKALDNAGIEYKTIEGEQFAVEVWIENPYGERAIILNDHQIKKMLKNRKQH